ncbi:MAG: IclR family transcriptional regulator [Desulfobacterales bacterium]|nr:IclR family transcriptional regulator [Desulfobacterales bacterium]
MNEINENGASLAGYQAPAVHRAFQLLKVVAESHREVGLSELAKRLSFSKSTTHGLIRALVQTGALAQSPRGKKFFLGPGIVELAFKNWNYFRVSEQARPVLDALRDAIGETVFLGVLSRSQGIIIAKAEAMKPFKISSPLGTSIPLLAGAVGKVFLAQLGDSQAAEVIREHGLTQFTARSIVNEKEYFAELARVRRQGYALDDEEYLPGVRAVACSLGNHRGLPLAIWIVGFAASMADEVLPRIIGETLKAAQALQSLLDGSG